MKRVYLIILSLLAALSVCSLCFYSESSLVGLSKANVIALASVPDHPTCAYGGLNSTECISSITLEGEFGSIIVYGCQISCPEGTYSCCNFIDCQCISY